MIGYVNPCELAGDCFRLVCVITIALGIITNSPERTDRSNRLDRMDINDFYILMYEEVGDAIKALSLDCMITLKKMRIIKSTGDLINWENFWGMYPFSLIDISPVLSAKAENDKLVPIERR